MSSTPSLCSVGVVVALAAEARVLTRTARPGRITSLNHGAGLWLGGMGPTAARLAALALADAGARALAVFGVAGALDAGSRSGALFCPQRIVDGDDGQNYVPDTAWRNRLLRQLEDAGPAVPGNGTLLSMSAPLLAAASKIAARDRHAALAVDMESAAVAAVASARGLPFLALRAIVDEVGDTIPAPLHESVDAWGRPRPLHLFAALCRNPSMLQQLPKLHGRMQLAIRALRVAALAASPTLGWNR